MKFVIKIMLVACVALSFALNAFAAEQVVLKADPSKISVKKGEVFEIKLTMSFKGEWYTYSMKEVIGPDGLGPMASMISIEPSDMIELKGNAKEPKPKKKFDKAFGIDILYHKGTAVFTLPVVAKKDLTFPNKKITIKANMQLCDSERCLPPEDYTATISGNAYSAEETPDTTAVETTNADVQTTETAGSETSISNQTPAPAKEVEKSDLEKKKEEGIFSFIWFSMTAGALALLTPCVFPMVPITVSFFTKRAEKSKGKGLRDALVYAFGIIFTFTALGFIFALAFGASGIQDFVANPWVNFVIAAIFVMFAFNLFGAFELQIPSSITNKLNAKSMEGDGLLSVVLMGLTFSLASFSCTGPLVAAALVSAASGDWFYPIISMLAFSSVLAAPFFLLALFPTALTSLPRAGGWMNNIKVVLGFVVIAATLKFLNNALYDWGVALSRDVFLAIWIAASTLATLYILGVFRMPHDSKVESTGSMRIVFALAFATITVYLFTGFSGKSMGALEAFLPAPEETQVVAVAGAQPIVADKWFENIEEAKAVAAKENKAIFLDFTGKHCTNCRMMERTVFVDPAIKNRFASMVKVKLITDLRGEPYVSNKKYQQDNFQTVALPFYVVLKPNGEVVASTAYTPDVNEFGAFLDKVLK